MTYHSGRYGAINGLTMLRNWNVNDLAQPHVIVGSQTRGATARLGGVRDWNGSASFWGAAPDAAHWPGSFFNFVGYGAPASDIYGTAGYTLEGSAYVESIALTINWETGAPLAYTMNFSGNGELSEESDTVQDLSEETPEPASGASIVYDNETDEVGSESESGSAGHFSETELCAASCTLTVTRPGIPYANSCTDGWVYRKAGILDWTLSVVTPENERDVLGLTPNDVIWLRINTSASAYYELKWSRFLDFSGITVNPESGEIIQQTLNFGMHMVHEGMYGTFEYVD